MKKKALFILFSLSLLASFSWSQGIRKPVAAGGFYPDNPELLSSQLDYFLQNAKKPIASAENIIALIAPHAGYAYAGLVAASAYRLVKGKDYDTVVIIGPSHYYWFEGCSIYLHGGFETPLGVAAVDEALALELSRASGYGYIPEAYQKEHSVEVQVPYIQKTLPKAKIVPIVMGHQTRTTITALANALSKVLPGKKVLVVASTDMSHYLPKKDANDIDANTASLIKSFNTELLLTKVQREENIMCGGGPVISTLLYAKKRENAKVEILDYTDSSQSQHGTPESQVVGYLAAAVIVGGPPAEFALTAEEKEELLKLARQAINEFIRQNKVVEYKTQNMNFLSSKGAFVTLKEKGLLRGCIGYIEPVYPLYQTVIQTAILAACRDPRFPPVSVEELDGLEIEISVLTPLEKIDSPKVVEVGKHGLVISQGDKKGVLLPQVPVENHWSRETFLNEACLKAGLPLDAWKSGADIYVFEAIVFHQ
jgi:AmmeMemoRadiSam system protein B/AmmeMemoRadiSam system protein A